MAWVLVVDDEDDIRETLRDLLEDAGHTVHDAASGADALATLRASEHPMVVLLDLFMPRLDGVGVLRAALADERLSAAHAYLLMTADNRSLLATATPLGEQLGAEVVLKPFDVDVLLAAVERAARRLPA